MTKVSVSVAATAIAKTSSGGVGALTDCLSTAIGCASRSISGDATSRLSRASVAKRITRSSVATLRRGHRRAQRPQDRGDGSEAEDFDRLSEHVEVAAVDDQIEVAAAFGGDLPGDEEVGLRQQRGDAVVDDPRLERVLLVDDHLDFGRFGVQGARAS